MKCLLSRSSFEIDNKKKNVSLLLSVNIEYRLKESMPAKIAGRLNSGRQSDSTMKLQGLRRCPAHYLDTLLRIFAQVPEVESLDPELVDELLEFALLPVLPEHLIVAEDHEMILLDGSLLREVLLDEVDHVFHSLDGNAALGIVAPFQIPSENLEAVDKECIRGLGSALHVIHVAVL